MRNPKFLGVYSRKNTRKAGTPRQLYFVWQASANDFAIQELDAALLPKGHIQTIERNTLAVKFQQEPSILAMPVSTPDIRPAPRNEKTPAVIEPDQEALLRLEKLRRAKQLEIDMRGNFNKAISALARPRDRQGAMAALEQLIRIREGIVPSHKHMFRDFGVSLRKKKLLDLALLSSNRVLELAPDDDHAHFNIARIYVLQGAWPKAIAHVQRAINIDSGEKLYPRLLAYIQKQAERETGSGKNLLR